ncbi:hypothetical protein LY39_00911 [Roseinatronobacter bogoriensis subsp. barguzinensis]|uniref:Uncharacterized protein n=2 Tax=Roseinatronobacter bogoriensis TaxID=119542 RepID=A0A2K8KB15_9RHOB|nr:hypothetical protein BG454_13085 [Rhodobaca barguzinensis]MBB4207811.1 hypothetical protein [Rhodobaca bogoriensis DSM 18756]TDW39883.1 hypothetical protein LY39_00911 [Rhodobaca barguzinensis]TDY70964.1 hypothetical protein EV660_102646 [Rhodobaca bogoriensis DSM 18756]
MRFLVPLLVLMLTLTGLGQAHVHSAGTGSEGQSQVPVLGLMLVEQAGRIDARSDPEPSANADTAGFFPDAPLLAAPKCRDTTYRANFGTPDLNGHISGHLARAPPQIS